MIASLKKFANRLNLVEWVRGCEELWFDTTRNVRTAGNEPPPNTSDVVGEMGGSYVYVPVRAANAHAALRDLPVSDYSQYTFVDMGSGKGRVLFIAAEYPFRKVLGVEFARELHQQTIENVARYRNHKRRCDDIESIWANAAEFEFPSGNLVLYLFNPFGPEVMRPMLANLRESFDKHPRHVVIVMLWPEHADLVARMEGVEVYRQTQRHHTYQLHRPV